MANEVAPPGKVWVCLACGKRSRDRYGYEKINHGWDESCMLNSRMLDQSTLVIDEQSNLVIAVNEEKSDLQPE